MDIVRFKSGLGNQMFQYAFYQALRSRERCVKANLGYYSKHPEKMRFSLTEVFPQISLEYISDEEFEIIDSEWRRIKENESKLDIFLGDYKNRFFWVEEKGFCYHPEVFETQNCTFVGYWQSEKYFQGLRDILLKDFYFAYGEKKLEDLCNKILLGDQYVSVHIRRGDYLNNPKVWGALSQSNYYINSICFMKEKIGTPQIVFFSDDIQWVKQKYHYENAIYIEESMFDSYQSWYDMRLMSCCSHNIIANSSFGWWGAWLNKNENKIVIAPAKWTFDGRIQKDICPSDWIRL